MSYEQQILKLLSDPLVDGDAELKNKLEESINYLIENDFQKLIQILYRIDVNEETLKDHLYKNKNKNPASVIADLIIRRQLEKQHNKTSPKAAKDIPEDEKW